MNTVGLRSCLIVVSLWAAPALAAQAPAPPSSDAPVTSAADEVLTCLQIADELNALSAQRQEQEQASARQTKPKRSPMMFGLAGALVARAAAQPERPRTSGAALSTEVRVQQLTALYEEKGC